MRPRDWPGDLGLPLTGVFGVARTDQVVLANGLLDFRSCSARYRPSAPSIEVVVSAAMDRHGELCRGDGQRPGARGGRDPFRGRDEHHNLAVRLLEHFLGVEGAAVARWPQAVRGEPVGQLVKRSGPPRDQRIQTYER